LLTSIYPGYLSFVEPSIASVSFIIGKGAPLYPNGGDASLYSLVYGPANYLPYTLALRMLGANIWSLKVVVLFANLFILWSLRRCYRHLMPRPSSLLGLSIVVACMLMTGTYLFEARGDILMIASVCVGLNAALGESAIGGALLLGAATGFCEDIKFTGVIYCLPLFALLAHRHGRKAVLMAAVGAVTVGLCPFLLPNISLPNYILRIQLASHHPFDVGESAYNVKVVVAISLAFCLLIWRLSNYGARELSAYLREYRVFLPILFIGLVAVSIPSGTIGAGPHHLMPFYPSLGYAWMTAYSAGGTSAQATGGESRLLLRCFCWAALAIFVAVGIYSDMSATVPTWLHESLLTADVASDLRSVMMSHRGDRIEMGYSDRGAGEDVNRQFRMTYHRPALVFAGNPLTIDATAVEDMQLSGLPIGGSTLKYLGGCQTQVWLIPKGGIPFVIPSALTLAYGARNPNLSLFGDSFRRTFLEHYRKIESSKYFDLWTC
jgi:hypothetical protein